MTRDTLPAFPFVALPVDPYLHVPPIDDDARNSVQGSVQGRVAWSLCPQPTSLTPCAVYEPAISSDEADEPSAEPPGMIAAQLTDGPLYVPLLIDPTLSLHLLPPVALAAHSRSGVDFTDPESQRVLAAAACQVARELGREAAREYFAELIGRPKGS